VEGLSVEARKVGLLVLGLVVGGDEGETGRMVPPLGSWQYFSSEGVSSSEM